MALDQWTQTTPQPELIGAVTTGTIWQFGRLHRATKRLEQGVNSYRVPDDLEPLMRMLVKALTG